MSLLLDTHVLLWLANPKQAASIGAVARRKIDAADVVYFSSITLAELRIKAMIGKLKLPTDLLEQALVNGLSVLDFNAQDSAAIERFQSLIRHDPFDRMLLAQAAARDLAFCTADDTLLGLQLPFVINASA